MTHACVFTRTGEMIPRGPYLTEDAAMTTLLEELTPKEKAG